MKKTAFCIILLTVGIFLLGARPAAAAPRYTFEVLPTLADRYTVGTCINNAGQVAGNSSSVYGAQHAFLYRGGVMQDLGSLGGDGYTSNANGINDAGQVVGWSDATTSSPYIEHAFRWTEGTMEDLGALTGKDGTSDAYGINNDG